jgi:hypothetical protein
MGHVALMTENSRIILRIASSSSELSCSGTAWFSHNSDTASSFASFLPTFSIVVIPWIVVYKNGGDQVVLLLTGCDSVTEGKHESRSLQRGITAVAGFVRIHHS